MSYQTFPVHGPFKGFVDSLPIPHTPPQAFDEIVNWLCRKGRVHLRPPIEGYAVPDFSIVRYIRTFRDVQGNLHSFMLNTKNAYYMTSPLTFHLLTPPGGLTDLSGNALPYGIAASGNRIYFCNGSTPILYTDGEATLKNAGFAGSVRYLTVNAFHLIGAYTTEPAPGVLGSTVFPNRVVWSAVGDFTDWTSFSSGAEDLVETLSELTGLGTLGQRTFVWRDNGITIMTPTGVGTAPFRFDYLSLADSGLGTRYPYSIALYNDQAMFVADSDIYIASQDNFRAIGGNAKKSIYADLARATGDEVQGFITTNLGPSIDYLSYWLSIPGVSTWVYSMDDDAWQQFSSSFGRVTAMSYTVTP